MSAAPTDTAAVGAVAEKLSTTSLQEYVPAKMLPYLALTYSLRKSDAAAPAVKPAGDDHPHAQVVTPWDVQGGVSSDGKQLAIDYDKLVDQFGTRRIDEAMLERFERLTGHKPHILMRRGMFFSHR